MFHVRDGWYFERTDNGGVKLFKQVDSRQTFGQPPYEVEFEMDMYAWASVVSSVSSKGESDGRFYQALDFHGQPLPKPMFELGAATGSIGREDDTKQFKPVTGATGPTGPISSFSGVSYCSAPPRDLSELFPEATHPYLKEVIIYDNLTKMLADIKAYTKLYPGKIYPCDLALSRKIGFVHENGTHWACSLIAVKNSSNFFAKEALKSQAGKLALCQTLSNVKE